MPGEMGEGESRDTRQGKALEIGSMAQAAVLMKPTRIEMMQLMGEPKSCTELGNALGLTPQKVYYHVKVLEKAGLVVRADERQVKGITEGLYQAAADTFLLSGDLAGKLGGAKEVRRQVSLGQLSELANMMLDDAQALSGQDESRLLTINAAVELADPSERQSFLSDVRDAIEHIARLYGAQGEVLDHGAGTAYKLVLACYERPELKGGRVSEN